MVRYQKLVVLLVACVASLLIVVEVGLDSWSHLQQTPPRQPLPEPQNDVVTETQTSISIKFTTNSKSLNADLPPSNVPNSSHTRENLQTTVKVSASRSVSQHRPILYRNQSGVVVRPRGRGPGGGGVLSPEQMLRILRSNIASQPIIPSPKVLRILVATYFRSGSTFLGEILQQNWKTYYHFEPLHFMSNGLRIQDNQTEDALTLLPELYRCNFSSPIATQYLKWASEPSHVFLLKRNRFLWVGCRMQPSSCSKADFDRYVCQRAPIQVMKVTRLNLDLVTQMMEENPDLDIRVVHLVRDPRGTINSRKVLDWCNTTGCSDYRVLCDEMMADYWAFQSLNISKPNRAFQIRYEDFSLHPENVIRKLFSSLGVPFSNGVRKFLKVSTKARPVDIKDPYSTRRDSAKTPFNWRTKLKYSEIEKIQAACSKVMNTYGYRVVGSPKDLVGDPPLLPFRH